MGRRSEARNRLIADLMARTDFMEKAGTGIARIKDACRDNKNNVSFLTDEIFWTEIKEDNTLGMRGDGKIKTLPKTLPKISRRVLELIIKDENVTLVMMAKECGVSKQTIQNHINELKKCSVIERVGANKGGVLESK